MHIEPGIVNGAKMILGMATAAGAGLWTLRLAAEAAVAHGVPALAARSAMATAATTKAAKAAARVQRLGAGVAVGHSEHDDSGIGAAACFLDSERMP